MFMIFALLLLMIFLSIMSKTGFCSLARNFKVELSRWQYSLSMPALSFSS
jgi:hypothetical protein